MRTCRRPRRWGSLTQWAVDAKRLSCVYAYDIGSRVGVQRTLLGLRFHWLAAFKLLACKWRREKLGISAPAMGYWLFPELVSKRVTYEVEGQQSEAHAGRGKSKKPPVAFHRVEGLRSVAQERSPAGLRRLHAEPKKRQE